MVFYHVIFSRGRRTWHSTGSKSRAEAEKIVGSDFVTKKVEVSHLTVSRYLPQFLEYAQANYAPKTVLIYEQAIRTLTRIVGDFDLAAYTVQDVEIYKAKRLKEVSPVKVNIDFRTLRAFFQTALRWELIGENPFHGVKQIKVPPKAPTYLTRDEFQKLLGAITVPLFKNLVVFAVCTMMRSGEIVSLTWDSIDLRRRLILIENTKEFRVKTSKPRAVPMNDWVFKFLATQEKKVGKIFSFPDGRQLTVWYVGHRFKKFIRKAGLSEDIHFHSLRHTGATWLVQDGVSIYAVQRLLGHSTISVTQVYTRLETDSLFNSIERLAVPTN